MASNHFTVDTYVADVLLRDLIKHDRQPAAFLLYLFLWSRTQGRSHEQVALSLGELADQTGLSKRTIQQARQLLVKRRLLALARTSPTATLQYRVLRPWVRQRA